MIETGPGFCQYYLPTLLFKIQILNIAKPGLCPASDLVGRREISYLAEKAEHHHWSRGNHNAALMRHGWTFAALRLKHLAEPLEYLLRLQTGEVDVLSQIIDVGLHVAKLQCLN